MKTSIPMQSNEKKSMKLYGTWSKNSPAKTGPSDIAIREPRSVWYTPVTDTAGYPPPAVPPAGSAVWQDPWIVHPPPDTD